MRWFLLLLSLLVRLLLLSGWFGWDICGVCVWEVRVGSDCEISLSLCVCGSKILV